MKQLSRLKRALSTPKLFLRALNRLYHRRLNRWSFNREGCDVMGEDWDILLLLDACRHDMFKRISDLPGTLDHRISRGSATVEFLHGTIGGREIHDTVYVTANPQLYKNHDEIAAEFYDVVNVWNDYGWEDEYGTVLPETMAKATKSAVSEYPNKRIIAHFVQPHYPFITPETSFDKGHLNDVSESGKNIWSKLMDGSLNIGSDTIWELYDDNLRRALEEIAGLLDELEGKIVVTSDHGNMVGEPATPIPIREWGHPRGIYTDELVTVPWHVYQNGDRPDIRPEKPVTSNSMEADTVDERLESLGYL